MKSIQALFPNASADTVAANPHLSALATVSPSTKTNDVQGNSVPNRGRVEHSSGFDMVPFGRKGMNKTEAEYALILEAMKRKGEILRYEYEGITLRWADMRYTPDFVVFEDSLFDDEGHPSLKLIEVKGGHIWDRDIVRFKGARAYWPEFQFEMIQKKKGSWNRIY